VKEFGRGLSNKTRRTYRQPLRKPKKKGERRAIFLKKRGGRKNPNLQGKNDPAQRGGTDSREKEKKEADLTAAPTSRAD